MHYKFTDTRYGGVFRNVLHFRCHEGSFTDADLDAICEAEPGSARMTGFLLLMEDSTSLVEVRFQKIFPSQEFEHISTFDAGTHVGTAQTVLGDFPDYPQAAACFIKKSYHPGRIGIGRVFVGPLCPAFNEQGRMLKDPVGAGDATDLLTAMGDPLMAGAGKLAKHCVCNAAGTGVTQLNDIRKVSLSPLVSMLRSRKTGVGE